MYLLLGGLYLTVAGQFLIQALLTKTRPNVMFDVGFVLMAAMGTVLLIASTFMRRRLKVYDA